MLYRKKSENHKVIVVYGRICCQAADQAIRGSGVLRAFSAAHRAHRAPLLSFARQRKAVRFSAHVNNEFASANSQRAQHASILCATCLATTKKTSKQLEILEKIWIIVNIWCIVFFVKNILFSFSHFFSTVLICRCIHLNSSTLIQN